MCANRDCIQFECVASSDTPELAICPECRTQMVEVANEPDMDETTLPKTTEFL
jgi:hypothetical protein